MKKLKIAQISKANAFGGGASRVAQMLAENPSDSYEIFHFITFGDSIFKNQIPLYQGKILRRILPRLINQFRKLGVIDILPIDTLFVLYNLIKHKIDIVHFHDISSSNSILTPIIVSRLFPTFWTIHDCSPFTGGCLYPMGCEKFRSNCSACPAKKDWPIDTFLPHTSISLKIRKWLYPYAKFNFISPSQWMADLYASSPLNLRPIVVISNGIDSSEFHYSDMSACKKALGIPEDKYVVLISAGGIEDTRKGVRKAFSILNLLPNEVKKNIFILCTGTSSESINSLVEGIDIKFMGYISSRTLQRITYSAADLMLVCSSADNQPLTILEAIMCGSKVLSLDTGGIPEIFKLNSIFGSTDASEQNLRQNLINSVENRDSEQVRLKRAWIASSYFSKNEFINSHFKVYQRLMETFLN